MADTPEARAEVGPIYDAHAPRLIQLAYRMLGAMGQAEEVVQEAFIRLEREGAEVQRPAAWLTTAVTRLCLDELKSARRRRETYVGPWLPEPIATAPQADAEGIVALAQDLSLAFLLLLENLAPEERVVFILREAFDRPYREIAEILGKSEAACRQIHRRSKGHLSSEPRYEVSVDEQSAVLDRFLAAIATGDDGPLAALLTEDVVLLSDGGGKAAAATRPLVGRHRVAAFVCGVARRGGPGVTTEHTFINGTPGLLVRDGEALIMAMALKTDGQLISAVYFVRNPDKLERVGGPPV